MNTTVSKQLTRLVPVFKQSWAPLHSSACLGQLVPLEYPNHKMAKDVRVRRECKRHVFERQSLVAMKRFKHLPNELRASLFD